MTKTKPLDKKNVRDIVALSPMQEGILFHYLNNPESSQYFEQLSLTLSGDIDPAVLEKTWNHVAATNEMLRTLFRWEKMETPVQIVLKHHPVPLKQLDFSSFDQQRKQQLLEEIKTKDKAQKFNLRNVPFRVTLCKLEEKRYEMIISNHHILYDGWSNGIILKEFQQAYEKIYEGKIPAKVQKNTFKEFIKWYHVQDKKEQHDFWQKYLKEFETKPALPTDKKKEGEISSVGKHNYTFSLEWTKRMSEFANQQGITLATLLYSVWGILLKRYNDMEIVVFGTTVSGRGAKIKDIENMVGLFINTLPLRIKTSAEEKTTSLLHNVDKALTERDRYENTPLVDIKASSQLDEKYNLFDSIMIIENYPLDKALSKEQKRLRVEAYSMVEMTNYDLAVEVNVFDQLGVNFVYNKDLFYPETVERMSTHFVNILQSVVEKTGIKIKDIRMLSPEERHNIMVTFTHNPLDYPKEKTIQEFLEERVKQIPENVAVAFEGKRITFNELNRRANSLARKLRAKGVGPDRMVGLMMERSIELIVAMIAILKAGGAYLPLVPDLPETKLSFMLQDSETQILLTQPYLKEQAEAMEFNGEVVTVIDQKPLPGEDTDLEPINKPEHLAYIIYTSGTTGTPKGVMVEHRNVMNYIAGMTGCLDFSPGRTMLGITTISFDIHVTETLLALCYGVKIIMAPEEAQRNPELMSEIIFKNDIHILQTTPSRVNILLSEISSMLSLKKVDIIMLGGEEFPETLMKELRRKTDADLYNMYGPTDTTVWSTGMHLEDPKRISIGGAIANTLIYILDRNFNPQPIGIPGELCIAGDGVTRGYLKRPELTAENFIPDPFVPGGRMYKTGDLAKWMANGEIQFIGRVDFQVKIRGFRIELGEIQTVLLAHKDITEAVVVDLEDDQQQKYLAAYVVAKKEIVPAEVRQFAAEKLAEYMLPSHIIQMDKFPLSTSGKINRKALPAPHTAAPATVQYEAPRNEIEEKLAKIWQELFAKEKIGINENFFDLGGHSIKAISLVARVSREFDVQLPVTEIFKTSHIKGLAKYIQEAEASIYLSIQPVQEGETFLLSAAQNRMYLLHQMEIESTTYNMPGVLTVEGNLDRERFQQAFRKLIQRHESFRTYFTAEEGEPQQKIHLEVEFNLEYRDLSGTEIDVEALTQEFIRPFELSRAPLIRAELLKQDEDEHLLLVDMHHIISDGTSLGIMITDFIALYEERKLPPLRVQYKGYTQWQQELIKKGIIKQQEEFWKSRFDGDI
ncbi:MAG: amino acid adenylation domain-containing protein, partial [bacterium]|nr:amino acid adenylation domain-containing protein [bacterium]